MSVHWVACGTCYSKTEGTEFYSTEFYSTEGTEFYSTGQTIKIKSHITCETPNDIYMIQCTKCNLQYIGETKRRLKDRFNEHRRPHDKPLLYLYPHCGFTTLLD